MTRQLHEAVKIMTTVVKLLNDKEEYSRCIIPTINAGRPGEKHTGEKRHQVTNPQELGLDLKRKRYDVEVEDEQ